MNRAEWSERVQNLKIVARWESTLPMVSNDALIQTVKQMLADWQQDAEQLHSDMQALQVGTAKLRKEIAEADKQVRELTNQVVLFDKESYERNVC
jgi:septal ring factor EnvC (AmiA/AmiB activator)